MTSSASLKDAILGTLEDLPVDSLVARIRAACEELASLEPTSDLLGYLTFDEKTLSYGSNKEDYFIRFGKIQPTDSTDSDINYLRVLEAEILKRKG